MGLKCVNKEWRKNNMGALMAQRVYVHAAGCNVGLHLVQHLQKSVWFSLCCHHSYLNELLLKLENRQTLSLLQDGKFCLLPVWHLIPAEGFPFPLRKIDRHSADASHIGSDLPSFICSSGEEKGVGNTVKFQPDPTSYNLLFYWIKMNCNDNELPNKLFLY